MTTEAIIGYETQYQTGDGGSPEAFTTQAEVTNVTPPGISRDSVDATHMQSPDGFREFIMGLADGGECSIEMNYTKGNAAVMLAEFNTRTLKNRKIILPDGSIWAFRAGITGYETEAPIDDKVSATATFKISGKPTFTAA